MSGTLKTQTQTPTPGLAGEHSERRRGRIGWRRLQVGAAAVTVMAIVFPMAVEGKVEGFLVAMAAPFIVGLVLAGFLPRVAAAFLGVVAMATLAFSAPYIVQALGHPESATDFVPLTFLTLSLAIGAAAAIPAFRELGPTERPERPSQMPRTIAITAGVVGAVASVVSIAAASGVDSAAAQPGDVSIETRNFAFAPAELAAQAGTISVHLANEDHTRHTFTIAGLTDLSVAPNSTQRTTFEAAPGVYRFFCRPHSDMNGVLVVE
jgi:plastocyanin